jgi:chemotaxis protein MotB
MRKTIVAALALVAIACGVSEQKYLAKEQEADKYMKAYQDESARATDLETELAASKQRVAELQQAVAEHGQEIETLEAREQRLRAQKKEYEALTNALAGQVASGQAQIATMADQMTVRLPGDVLFASGSAALSKKGKAQLDSIAPALAALTGKTIVITGFTDNTPIGRKSAFKTNLDLSAARSIAAVKYLRAKGVKPSSIGAAGFGEYGPVAPNDTPQNKAKNRRIELVIAPERLPKV